GTVVPKIARLAIPEVDIVDAPDFTGARKVSIYSGEWPGGTDGTRRPYNLTAYRMRSDTEYIPFNHGLSRLGLIERFGESHPDYFALLSDGRRDNDFSRPHPGQLSLAHPGLREEIYQDAKSYLTGEPPTVRNVIHRRWEYQPRWDLSAAQPGFFCVMPQDSFRACLSDYNKAFLGQGKTEGDLVWDFTVDIANRLTSEGVPGALTQMAYARAKMVPEIAIPDNVVVMLAVRGAWNDREPETRRFEEDLLEQWRAKLAPRGLWLWNYANKFGGVDLPGIPNSTPRAIGRYYQRMGPRVLGVYMQSDAERSLFNYLNHYVFFKTAWNTGTDTDALLEEHHRLMFGAGAKSMAAFFDDIEELWIGRVLGSPIYDDLGPAYDPPSEAMLWQEIYSRETLERLETHLDEAAGAAAADAMSLKRIAFMRDHFFGPLAAARRDYLLRQRDIDDLVFPVLPRTSDIALDGAPDEPAWAAAEPIVLVAIRSDGVQVRTRVLSLWDADALHLAFECEEPLIGQMSGFSREPDDPDVWRDSSVEIFLDPTQARESYGHILLNAWGSLSDQKVEGSGRDWTWSSGA
ncbi:MAG: DUF4838 domain-containing protein, partial [Kiritimatiellia bacterium]|nr:DUF4838 domain-containing protein [Kiritimatiellia bacterium]